MTRGIAVQYKQLGLTLVEIMVALAISLVLLTGVIEMFLAGKAAYRTQDQVGRMQENARFALHAIAEDLRMAGYLGCFSGSAVNNIVRPGYQLNGLADYDRPLSAFDYSGTTGTALSDWTPNLPAYFSAGDVIAGSDVFVIKRGDSDFTLNKNPPGANVKVDDTPDNDFQVGDVIFVADCSQADIFKASTVSEGSGYVTFTHAANFNTSTSLSKSYGMDAAVMKMITNAYFVSTNAAGNPALYRRGISGGGGVTTEELVEGVETMHVVYGEDTNADGIANRFVNAAEVTNIDNVVSVRIGLLVRSQEEVTPQDDSTTYSIVGTNVGTTGTTPVHSADRRLRYVFTTAIKIRNRGVM